MAEFVDNANPFSGMDAHSWVAISGARNGYIQLAPGAEITTYSALDPLLFQIAQDWAARLEALGSPRVYWITLSEAVPHLHIHLYPRWPTDTIKGIALFEQRENSAQPQWLPEMQTALGEWAAQWNVFIIK